MKLNKSFKTKQMDKYEKFVTNHFGEIYEIMHEIISPDIHLDVIVIKPTKEKNYYTLITMGMSGYKMEIPKGYDKSSRRAELIIYLPNDWNIHSKEKDDFWPIEELKKIARMPMYENSFLAPMHTISDDEKNTSFSKNTKLCSFVVTPTFSKPFYLGINFPINFYTLIPIYKEELDYIHKNGYNSFIELCKLNKMPFPPVLDLKRNNICKN